MALCPKYECYRMGSSSASHVIEAFWDFCCPYSKKSFSMLTQHVMPYLESQYPGRVQLIFRHQLQPWHPQGTLLHEAALAVALVKPEAFWSFANVLFDESGWFYDRHTYQKSRQEMYKELAQLTAKVEVKPDDVFKMLEYKDVEGENNSGNGLTKDLLYHVKIARQQSIHFSPTMLIDGLVDNTISSSWTLDQWKSYLKNLLE